MVFTLRPSAHLPTLSTRAGLGTISRSSGIVRFVQGGVVKTFRWASQAVSSRDGARRLRSVAIGTPLGARKIFALATVWSFGLRALNVLERLGARSVARDANIWPRIHTDFHGCCAVVFRLDTSSVLIRVHPWLNLALIARSACTSSELERFSPLQETPNMVFTLGRSPLANLSAMSVIRFGDVILRWRQRHTLALCSSGVPLVQCLPIRHLSVPQGRVS
jgi:hypothetical protein